MIKEGYICIQSFLLGLGILSYFIYGCSGYNNPIFYWIDDHLIIYCIIFYVIINIFIFIIYRQDWQVAVRSCFIGTAFGIGTIICVICSSSYKPFGFYLIILSFFHFSEYLITAVTNPATLSIDSFLLNHSIAYWLAASASWVEFFIERWLVTSLKEYWYIISVVGIIVCMFGEGMRKLAMITASTNFNHIVQVQKKDDHELVTWGVYRFSRHPSYVGWFWWSIGTQIILINPFCLVAYTIASWSFFNERVRFEEMTLIKFFGQKYLDYKRRVGTGLPFISGYTIGEKSYKE